MEPGTTFWDPSGNPHETPSLRMATGTLEMRTRGQELRHSPAQFSAVFLIIPDGKTKRLD
jgi:hypothetical protein